VFVAAARRRGTRWVLPEVRSTLELVPAGELPRIALRLETAN